MFDPRTIQLPKKNIASKDVCTCRPVCRRRRREWNGQEQPASEELMLHRTQKPECLIRYPKEVNSHGLCPLLRVDKRVGIKQPHQQAVLRLCAAPLDDEVDTTYLEYMQLAKDLGAWQMARPPPCKHRACTRCLCCSCDPRGYHPAEPEPSRADVRSFDSRVKQDADVSSMRVMY